MTKKIFLVLLMNFFSFLNAHDKNFGDLKLSPEKMDAIIAVYNTEINLLEDYCPSDASQVKKILSLYSQRADLNFARKSYHAALRDYKKIISHIEDVNLFEPGDFLRGICGCLFCYQCLDDDESAKKEFSRLIYYVALWGKHIETVDWLKNNPVYSAYKKSHENYKERIFSVNLPELTSEEFCEFQCAGYAVAASSACLKSAEFSYCGYLRWVYMGS